MNQAEYIDKVILIGLTFVDDQDNVVEQYQTHGVIKAISEDGMVKIERKDLPEFTIPFDEESISEAAEGVYRERSTGVEINNPDFLSSWTIHQSNPDSLENNKLYGFEPPDDE